MRQQIAIFFTGGTISMRIDPQTGGPVPALSGEEIIARVEGLTALADIEVINWGLLPGPHMTPPKMFELSRAVEERLLDDAIRGVVVTHGTDTLEETAYLLELTLRTEKPVVFVGAMRNSSELSWDGPANLRSAVRVAIEPSARGLGVIVVMSDQLIAATDAVKTHTESVATFQSRDFGPLGVVDKDRIIVDRHRTERIHFTPTRLEERVDIVKLSAGSDGRYIQFAVGDGAQGLVIEGLGRGNVPVAALPALECAIQAGIPVVITSRCPHGRVLDTYAYEGAGRQLRRMGVILGGLLPSHKARLKLMVMLGAGCGVEEIRASFEN